jgi:F420-0:gamma-glutamyl ligase-like protein
MNPEEALRIAALSNRARGDGAGRTIWDVAERFKVDITGVTWNMLESIPHYPVVIVRISTHA